MSPDPPLVKPIAAVLYRDDTLLEQCLARLEAAFSPVDCRGAAHRFDLTDYYAPEMGSGLCRVLVSFSALRVPPFLVDARHTAAATEDAFRLEEKRRVNVDVGYLDLYKVVLASWKGRGHKLYLDRGVWADIVLTFAKGRFHPLPWSFPDFRAGRYDAELRAMRRRYLRQLRGAGPQRERRVC